jgi:Transposase
MTCSTAPALPTVPQLAWLLVVVAGPANRSPGRRPRGNSRSHERDREAAAVIRLGRRFTALVRARDVAGRQDGRAPADPAVELNTCLAEARTCGTPATATFAAELEADGAAIRAALTQPWNSGHAEGQINRLKLPRRQSYGQASFDLLRRRVLRVA